MKLKLSSASEYFVKSSLTRSQIPTPNIAHPSSWSRNQSNIRYHADKLKLMISCKCWDFFKWLTYNQKKFCNLTVKSTYYFYHDAFFNYGFMVVNLTLTTTLPPPSSQTIYMKLKECALSKGLNFVNLKIVNSFDKPTWQKPLT